MATRRVLLTFLTLWTGGALLGAPVSAQSRPPLSAADVVARSKAALAAKKPASEIEDWDVVAGGLTGTVHLVARGEEFREASTLGPLLLARGKFGAQAWHQNENGYTILEQADGAHDDDAVRAEHAELVSAPLAAYLVTARHGDGAVTRTYYDPQTYAVRRAEREIGGWTTSVVFDDFRASPSGRVRAWHEHGGDGHAGNDFDLRLRSDRENVPVADADLAVPGNRREIVEFPPGHNSVRLPATIQSTRVYVTVTIEGNDLTFLLDTGASGIVLNAQAARELHLATYGSETASVAGNFPTSVAIAHSFSVGDLQLRDVAMMTAPIDSREGPYRVVGLLGYDFIAGAVLRIDYDKGTVDAVRPAAFTAPIGATASAPIRLNKQVPQLDVGVGVSTVSGFVLDTGALATVMLFEHFVRAHPQDAADMGVAVGDFDPEQSYVIGVGGRLPVLPLRLRSFRLADLDFRNFLVLRSSRARGLGDERIDGLIGSLFLRLFTLYVDYPHGTIYFEPNSLYHQAVTAPLR